MIKKILVTAILCLFTSCSIIKHAPPEHTIIHIKDSTVYHIIDSIKYIPIERIKDVVPNYDTLMLETSLAKAVSYVDTTTHTLCGSLTNKEGYTEKIKYVEKVVYKDTTITVEVPYPVEVTKEVIKYPKTYWWFLGVTILVIAYAGIKTYMKFKIK